MRYKPVKAQWALRRNQYRHRENAIMLNVRVENQGKSVVLHCVGRIVRGEETALLCAAVQQTGRDVVLDLAAVDAIDAAGIGVLVSLQAAGIYLTLANPGRQVREMLTVTHVDSIFEIHRSRHAEEIAAPAAGNSPLDLLPV